MTLKDFFTQNPDWHNLEICVLNPIGYADFLSGAASASLVKVDDEGAFSESGDEVILFEWNN